MNTSKSWIPAVLICTAFLFSACSEDGNDASPSPSAPTSQFDSQIAQDWANQAYNLVRNESLPPTAASRIYGYLGLAMYEAVVPGMPSNLSLAR